MARPEAGYSYSQPSSSYGAPSGGYSLAGGVGGIGGIGFGGGVGVGGGFGGVSPAGIAAGVGPDGISVPQKISSSGTAGIVSSVGAAGGVSGDAAAALRFASARQIVRDVYVYGPSKDLEAPGVAGVAPQYQTRPPQKHYKIVFIKAPTPPTPTAPVIPVQQQDEQKTLIYVLVKKPEEAPEINLPTITPTQPSKPEVYFIKYKTQVKKRNLSIRNKKKQNS